MSHPVDVTLLLAEMQMDTVCLQTGLLHDVVEDTGVTIDEIQKKFGEEVARCVDGVTKIEQAESEFAGRPPGREHAQDAACNGHGYSRDPGETRRPTAQHAHSRRVLAGAAGARPRRKRSTFMRPSPIVSAWAKCAANSRIWRSSTWSRKPTAELMQQIEEKRQANEEILQKMQRTMCS